MCQSCEMLNINGLNCHETGCPDAWLWYHRECCWCGQLFLPDQLHQKYCSCECFASDNGLTLEEKSGGLI